MAKLELTDKELEQVNGGVTINFMGSSIEITPDTIQQAVENGTAQNLLGLVQTFGKNFKRQISQLYAEYDNPETNPNGYTMPAELDEILQNL